MNTFLFSKKTSSKLCLWMSFFWFGHVKSQIVYTDIPDATPSASYYLDLNNDEIDDFLIQFDENNSIVCKALHKNSFAGNFSGGLHLPWALSSSQPICDTTKTWYDSSTLGTLIMGTSFGHWIGQTNKYLALKLMVGSSTYYGWARLDIATSSFTIKDYAYQSTSNSCILTGQTQLSAQNSAPEKLFLIFPNPVQINAQIQFHSFLKSASLKVFNSAGKLVTKMEDISGSNCKLNATNLPNGMYYCQISENNEIIGSVKISILK